MAGQEPEPHSQEDLVPDDDRVIGQALRWSFAVIAVGCLAGLGIWLSTGDEEAPEEVVEKNVGRIDDRAVAVESVPEVRFTDVTAAAGIDFVHANGATGEKLLPETMGGSVAFLDYDRDGAADLFFVSGAPWCTSGPEAGGASRLYRGDGRGGFEDVTAAAGLANSDCGMGVAVGDADGDGWSDLYVTGVGRSRLYRNVEGRFEDVTEAAGVAGPADQWSTSAGFYDLDTDGDLDLFVCQYVQWSRAIDEQLAFTLNGRDRAYGPPLNYAGVFSRLYRNDGGGRFTDVSAEAGIQVTNEATGEPAGKALGVVFGDFDGDGKPDIVVANDTVQNHLFRGLGELRFEEVGARSGIGFDANGKATGAMGVDLADYRDNGEFGICIGNFANEMSSLYVGGGGRLFFSDDAMGEGIGSPSRQKLSFGVFFFDYDLDGRQDLLQVNGHLEEAINEVQPSQHYLQAPQLFWNGGPDARFCYEEVAAERTGDLARELAGRGSAFADIDGDGDLDVAIAQVGRAPLLLRNDQALGHHWLRVRLVGQGANREAIGAWVELTAGGRTMRRHVTPTRSYLSQSELPVTFGLGKLEAVESLVVHWPDGERRDVPIEGIDRELTVER